MARIAFDAKRAFHNNTGLGNYSRFILSELVKSKGDAYEYLLMNPKPGALFSERDPRLKEILPEGIYSLFSSLWRSGAMWKDLQKNKVDLFHGLSNELPAGIEKQRIKSLVTIHDLIFESHPHFYKPADRRIYRHKFKSASKNADRVLTVSQFTKDQLVDRYDIESEKIFVHYQSCHPAFQVQGNVEKDVELIKPLQIPTEYALSVGTIEERKNLLNSLSAIKTIDIPLVVVGNGGDYFKKCRDFVENNGMKNRVFWIQNIERETLAALYRQAQLLLYPSRVEGFGIPIIEGLFSNTPVITSNGGVFPEAGGPKSWYINPESPEEINGAITDILNHPQESAKRADEGRLYAEENFLPEILIAQLDSHYSALLA